MKIFTVDKIRLADEYTIQHEPIASIDLMERASRKVANYLLTNYSKKYKLDLVVGKGNNGGDGLAVARMMLNYGYRCSIFLAMGEEGSDDFLTNLDRLKKLGGYTEIESTHQLISSIENSTNALCIDALFGSGLSRPIKGDLGELIQKLNNTSSEKISIDIPSGLYSDKHTEQGNPVFISDLTLSMQFPKLAFLMPENEEYVPNFEMLDIGIHNDFIEQKESYYSLVTKKRNYSLSSFSHKGDRGRVFIVAGGYGRMGAALMAAKASLKAGAGLVTVHTCKHCIEIVQAYLPEALISIDYNEYELGDLPDLSKQNALVIGPAIGFASKTESLFLNILTNFEGKIIVDADAITMLANNKTLWEDLPVNTILTPHIGEFDRLFGRHENQFDRLVTLREKAVEFQIFIVLKGKYTAICDPEGNIYFNTTGNTGMAKGGSGDVLAGMIGAYLCLYDSIIEAIIAAVFDHGLAADMSVKVLSKGSLLPTDLLENLHRIENN